MPAFAPVMPKISGGEVCVVPFPRTTCEALKAAAAEGLTEGSWVSSDDVVLAHVWKAMCEMRCSQLGGLPLDSQETTTCVRCAPSRRLCFGCGPWSHSLWVIPRSFLSRRACNIRKRTQPPLGAGYCANGVVQVFTALSVRELISSSPSAVAQVGSHPVPVVCKYV